MAGHRIRIVTVFAAALFSSAIAGERLGFAGVSTAEAQQLALRDKRGQTKPKSAPAPRAQPAETVPPVLLPEPPGQMSAPAAPAQNPASPPQPPEKVEADVSARSVAIELGFTGTEIIVFGSIDNSRQPSGESGYYDLIVTLEGQPTPLVVRRKTNVAGLWMNTASNAVNFDRVPSYYAIASTRPINEFADSQVLAANSIGFEHVKIRPKEGRVRTIAEDESKAYRDAIVRLKQKDGLYISADYDVAFIGRSLFRTTISLPANIAVGPLDARVFLFHEGELLSQYTSRVTLEREGVELWLHVFAHKYPFWYGMFTVAVALSAGLLASALFRRGAH